MPLVVHQIADQVRSFRRRYFDRRNDITAPTPQFGAFVETTRYPAEEVAA